MQTLHGDVHNGDRRLERFGGRLTPMTACGVTEGQARPQRAFLKKNRVELFFVPAIAPSSQFLLVTPLDHKLNPPLRAIVKISTAPNSYLQFEPQTSTATPYFLSRTAPRLQASAQSLHALHISANSHRSALEPPRNHRTNSFKPKDVHREETPHHMSRPRHHNRAPWLLDPRRPDPIKPLVQLRLHAEVQRHNKQRWSRNKLEAQFALLRIES